ncbi:MAG: hypothetical protein IT168_13855 [Bryobacterales bacterium]|nr:hypothetical protein [Bryobacterales bacterium]
MFGIDWGNSETLWLNVTNLALGLVVAVAIGVLVSGVLYETVRNWMARRRLASADVTEALTAASPHTYFDPQLGLTMADGGEPETRKKKPANTKKTR